ncbi:Fatty acid-binding protein, brain [Chionoecetes opilio]|uniref:Fatty acid-binding protein, brain n=1 Tax=Chionoecetes opilio TaxID=41210 RepID=A0A8J4YI09_CHIOP|nr:Fatty acid-binding protein, brain [Chionoecetes opilio]
MESGGGTEGGRVKWEERQAIRPATLLPPVTLLQPPSRPHLPRHHTVTMAPPFDGKYVLDTSENFEEFMKTLGVGIMLRKLGSSTKPTVEISVSDGEFSLKTTSTLKATELKFRLGEDVTETTIDGRECKTVFKQEGNKLIQTQTAQKGKSAKFTREFTDTEMIMRCQQVSGLSGSLDIE